MTPQPPGSVETFVVRLLRADVPEPHGIVCRVASGIEIIFADEHQLLDALLRGADDPT